MVLWKLWQELLYLLSILLYGLVKYNCVRSVIIILVITFMQDIYKYIPETNSVSRVCSVAAVLHLQFLLHVTLFRPWSTFCTFTVALSVVCVQCPIWLFFFFFQFLNFVLSWYVTEVLSEWFWNGFQLPLLLLLSCFLSHYYYYYHYY